jgi:hypothetical protein
VSGLLQANLNSAFGIIWPHHSVKRVGSFMFAKSMFILLVFLATGAFGADGVIPNVMTMSFVTIRITPANGMAREITLDHAPSDSDPRKFVETKLMHQGDGVLHTITLAMEYQMKNGWEQVDGLVPKDKFVPYYIPAISISVSSGSVDAGGFTTSTPYGHITAIPSRVGAKKVVEGLTIEVVKIEDNRPQARFEASEAEAACFDMKYTHKCMLEVGAKHTN